MFSLQKNIIDIIFTIVGCLLVVQGIVTFIFYNLTSTEKALAVVEEKERNSIIAKIIGFFEFDVFINITFFLTGVGIGIILTVLEWKVFPGNNKTSSLFLKAIISLSFIFIANLWVFFLLPKNEINVKNIDKITVDISHSTQLIVTCLGLVVSLIFYEILEIIQPRVKILENISEKEDLNQVLSLGAVLAGALLSVQSLSNLIMCFVIGFSTVERWFLVTSIVILILSVVLLVGGVVTLVTV